MAEETKISNTEKRARIEEELRKYSARSDREIGRLCGVDGKTVAAARERWLGLTVEDAPTAYLLPTICAPPPDVANEPETDDNFFDQRNLAVPHQPAIAVYGNPFGAVVIRQECLDYGGDDPFIIVQPRKHRGIDCEAAAGRPSMLARAWRTPMTRPQSTLTSPR
jgi:hypothetical protein